MKIHLSPSPSNPLGSRPLPIGGEGRGEGVFLVVTSITLHHQNVLQHLTNLESATTQQAATLKLLARSFLRSNCGLERDAEEMQKTTARLAATD